MKPKKIGNILLTIFSIAILIAILLYGFGVLQTFFQAPAGWKSYGESGSIITGLNLVSDQFSSTPSPYGSYEKIYSSTYWDIKETLGRGSSTTDQSFLSGDDFNLGQLVANPNIKEGGALTMEFTTKEPLGKGKDFRVELHAENIQNTIGNNWNVDLVTSSGTIINAINPSGIASGSSTRILEIQSSPVVDTVQIYVDGALVNTLSTSEDYLVRITYGVPHHTATSGDLILIKKSLRNPAFKDVYNCQVDPDEQYYSSIFKGPITFSKNDLQNFHKWCLDEFPATIYTNAGSTTDQMILLGLENGQSFVVPNGQLYQITYIGEKKSLTTPCEQDELLVNGDTCTARTVLEIDLICQSGGSCPEGEPTPEENISEPDTQSLIIETEAVDYIVSSLQTHQFLANNSKIRFTHYADDFSSSPSSFNLFGKIFASDGIVTPFGAEQPKGSFVFDTTILGYSSLNEIIILDEFNKVSLTRVELQNPANVGIGDSQKFLAEWTFDIDTAFLVLSYDEQTKEIIVTNNYHPVSGGISLIKDNGITQTNQEITNLNFGLGETKVSIGDTTGLVSVAGRPYFEILTPDSNYKLSGSSAITISDLEEDQIIVNIADEPATPPIQLENIQGGDKAITSKKGIKISTGTIAGIVGGLVVGTLIFFIIKGLRRPRRR